MVIFLYPFVVCLASLGLYNSLRGRVTVWLIVCILVMGAAYYVESTMLNHGGIMVGLIPGQSQTISSLLSMNLALGLGILIWKAIPFRRIQESPRLIRPYRSSPAVVVGLIAIASLSQASMLVQTSPYFAQSSFNPLEVWLNTNVKNGDVILTNGNSILIELTNDSLLRLIHEGGVKVLPTPATLVGLNSTTFLSYACIVVFKNPQYTNTDSYNATDYSPLKDLGNLTLSNTVVDVYSGPAPTPASQENS